MGYENYLLAANVAVWLGIGGYLVFLATGQKKLEQGLRRMETMFDER